MAIGKRRPRGLKGAVLVMVVTILFILIVMLLATLAVVSSSTQRTYTKFEETQAYYSARSVLEVYIKEVLSDKAKNGDAGFSATETKIINAMKNDSKFTQVKYDNGGTLTEGLPHNGTNAVDFGGNELSNGFAYQQELFGYLEPKYKWEPGSSDPGLSDPKDNRNWKIETDNESKCYVEYEATVPDLTSPAMVTNAGAHGGKFDSDGKVRVKVELLRILYRNSDGKIITDNVPKSKHSGSTLVDGITGDGYHKLQTISVSSTDKDFVVDWKKVYYRLKVTATADLDGSEVSVSVLLEPTPATNPSGFRNAMTTIAGTESKNQLFTIGGASANLIDGVAPGVDGNDYMYSNDNISYSVGRYVYKGNYGGNKAPNPWMMTEGECFTVYNGIYWAENEFCPASTFSSNVSSATGNQLKNRPFVYMEGAYLKPVSSKGGAPSNQGVCIGTDANHAVDLIVTSKGSGQKLNGFSAKVPAYHHPEGYGPNKEVTESEFPACLTGNDAELNNIALISGQNGMYVFGDVYCDGNMYLHTNSPGCVFYGKVYCTGTIYVDDDDSAKAQFKGETHAADIVKASDGSEASNVKAAIPSGLQTVVSLGLSGLNEANPVVANNGGNMKYTLPHRGDVYIPTVQFITSSFIDPATGKLRPADKQLQEDMQSSTVGLSVSGGAKNIPATGTAGSMVYDNGIVSGTINGILVEPPASTSSEGDFEYIIDLTHFENNDKTYLIDATTQPVRVQLKKDTGSNPASIKSCFVFVGDKPVRITVADNEQLQFQGLKIFNAEIYLLSNMSTHSGGACVMQDFCLGDKPTGHESHAPSAPNISWYIGKDAKFFIQNGEYFAATGYIYGPEANFDCGNSNEGSEFKSKCDYNGQTVKQNFVSTDFSIPCIAFFGAMLVKNAEVNNPLGIYYIKPDAGGGGGGGAGGNIDWNRQRYLNT